VHQRVEQGQVLDGRFRLHSPLAEDPQLDVWLAEDLDLHRDVVVKVLHPRWMDDVDMVERFRYEALAAARLIHENIARTFDVESSDGALYTVSEYIDGPTVEELLDQGTLEAVAVASIGMQAAQGLAAAHADGLVHRAICPPNLLVATHGRLCIIDFGSVQPARGEPDLRAEPSFPEPGMRTYWPPERHEGLEVDETGDVYSLGLVLWEALTGTPQPESSAGRHPVRRVLDALPGGDATTPHLRELLTEATARQPEERPTAATFAAALGEICGVRPQDHLAPLVVAREAGRE
jgi:eukaryotic-like serine/threonine-protein kinase